MKISKILKEFPNKHPDLPLYISVIALVISIILPIIRRFLEQMT